MGSLRFFFLQREHSTEAITTRAARCTETCGRLLSDEPLAKRNAGSPKATMDSIGLDNFKGERELVAQTVIAGKKHQIQLKIFGKLQI